ncbi:hypothetical protein ACIQF5_29200 [Streptomyces goshikiensis]|uniref:hypothetical protein n=1 Tax=Streptomyces goshikiensis TaxID=1942 RepID=UPI00381D1165
MPWRADPFTVQPLAPSTACCERAVPSPPAGGYAWDAARREAYANDQASPVTLIAVTVESNRSKSDKDPAQWAATKLRWDLDSDDAERQALLGFAEDCPITTVVYERAL